MRVILILVILTSLLKRSNCVCFNETYTYEEICSGSFHRVQDEPLACGIWSDSPLADCRIISHVGDHPEGLYSHDIIENLECVSLSNSSNSFCQQQCVQGGSYPCNGNLTYCSLRLNQSMIACDSLADCFCSLVNSSTYFTFYDKFEARLLSGTVTHIPAYQDDVPSSLTYCGEKSYKILLSSDGDVEIKTNQTGNYHCRINKGQSFDLLFKDGINFTVPDYYLIKSSNLTVNCFCNGIVVKTNTKKLLPSGKCLNYPFWSKGWFRNVSCWDFSDWFYMILIISFLLTIILLIKKLMKFPRFRGTVMLFLIPFKMFWWFLKAIFMVKDIGSTPVSQALMSKFKSLKESALYWFTPNAKKYEPIPNTSAPSKGSSGKIRYYKGMPIPEVTIGLILILSIIHVPQVESVCFSSNVVTGNLTTCVETNGLYSCQLRFASLIDIPDRYSNSCINIVDSEGHHVLQLEIGAFIKQKVSLQSMYYTAPWDFDLKYNSRCNGQTLFTHDVTCPNAGCLSVNENDYTATVSLPVSGTKERQLDTPSINYPGYTGCVNADSGTCLQGPYACTYYRYVLKPQSVYAQVNKIFSTTNEIGISIEVKDVNSTSQAQIYKIGNNYFVGSDRKVKISPIGTYQTPSVFVENQYVVVEYDGRATINSASPNNVIGVGLGDYQADTLVDLYKIGKPIFDKSKFVIQDNGNNGLKYTYQASTYLKNIGLGKPFPQVINGETYHYDSGYLTTELVNPPAIALYMETVLPINVYYKKVDVNPECVFKHASGTSDSGQGSVVILTCKSTVDPGVVSLTTDQSTIEIKTKSLLLSTINQDFDIQIMTSSISNSFYIKVQGTSNSQKVYIKFEAPRPDHSANTTNSQKTGVKDSSEETPYSDFGDDLLDGFQFGSIVHAILSYGIIIVIVISIILLGCFILKRTPIVKSIV